MSAHVSHTNPLRFFFKEHRRSLPLFFTTVFFYALGSASATYSAYTLGQIVDALGDPAHTSQFWPLMTVLGAAVLYEVCYRIGHIGEVYSMADIRARTKQILFDHTQTLHFGYFAERFAGEIAHKVSKSADTQERLGMIIANVFFDNGAIVLLSIGIMSTVHIYYGLFVTVWILVYGLCSYLFAQEMSRRASDYATVEADTTGSLVDTYGNISALKVYGATEERRKAHEAIEHERSSFIHLGWWDVATFHFQGLGMVLLTVGTIGITAHLYMQGAISPGDIVLLSTAAVRLFSVAWETGKQFGEFIRAYGECHECLSDILVAPLIRGGMHDTKHQRDVGITYDSVTFAYSADMPVLSTFSLSIAPKEKIGIVGLSGAGKTTFMHLLLRFFDVQSGRIALNSTPITDMREDALRAHMSYIAQDTSLFHSTIAANIAYGSPAASFDDIVHAARLAHADDFIRMLPKKYESVVGERGIKLSGGQRQRIAIARAILANRPIFLLDEATSALDSESERAIQDALAVVMRDKTVITIAHRLSTLRAMDRIVVLHDGRIYEEGTHDELTAKDGEYAKLWRMQTAHLV